MLDSATENRVQKVVDIARARGIPEDRIRRAVSQFIESAQRQRSPKPSVKSPGSFGTATARGANVLPSQSLAGPTAFADLAQADRLASNIRPQGQAFPSGAPLLGTPRQPGPPLGGSITGAPTVFSKRTGIAGIADQLIASFRGPDKVPQPVVQCNIRSARINTIRSGPGGRVGTRRARNDGIVRPYCTIKVGRFQVGAFERREDAEAVRNGIALALNQGPRQPSALAALPSLGTFIGSTAISELKRNALLDNFLGLGGRRRSSGRARAEPNTPGRKHEMDGREPRTPADFRVMQLFEAAQSGVKNPKNLPTVSEVVDACENGLIPGGTMDSAECRAALKMLDIVADRGLVHRMRFPKEVK